VIVAGVTFDDGTIYRELTPADLDELEQYKLRFIRPAGVQTAVCHDIAIFQGTEPIN
jgi:hypothetical protein